MGRVKAIATVALVTGALGFTAEPAQPRSKRDRCFPPHTRTLLASREARVYARTPSRRSERRFDIFGCAYATGRPWALEELGYTSVFTPPAISLAGPIIGFAYWYADPASTFDFDQGTAVISHDLRIVGANAWWTNFVKHEATLTERPPTPVGSVRVNRRGSIAWIVCAASGIGGSVARRCNHPGDFDRVLMIPAGTDDVQILDKGREIDPDSLELHGSRLSWRRSGRTRHATLR